MRSDMNKIANELSSLLETVKVKPVVKQEAKTEAPKGITEDHSTVALEIVKTVFENAPTGIDPSSFGDALIVAAEIKAEETKLTTVQVMESVIDYLIKTIESAQGSLEEDKS